MITTELLARYERIKRRVTGFGSMGSWCFFSSLLEDDGTTGARFEGGGRLRKTMQPWIDAMASTVAS